MAWGPSACGPYEAVRLEASVAACWGEGAGYRGACSAGRPGAFADLWGAFVLWDRLECAFVGGEGSAAVGASCVGEEVQGASVGVGVGVGGACRAGM